MNTQNHVGEHSRWGTTDSTRFETIVIGGGQSGLAVGYHLKQHEIPFVILDASEQIGDSWRDRWDSLRLFTPARYNGLPGMSFPADPHYFPTKDEMADYLATYAERFELPVRTDTRVDRLTRTDDRYVVTAGSRRFEARNVVVAMSTFQKPRIPDFAGELAPDLVQFHSSEYRNPSQLQEGSILIAGAGNSGSEIALEVAADHNTWMAGRDTGHLPFRISSRAGLMFFVPLVLRVLFHRVLKVNTWLGRKVYSKITSRGGPLIRVKPRQINARGIERVPKVTGVRDGLPVLADGRVIDVANVIWCTGFHPGFSWIDVPVFGENGEVRHESGVADGAPGLYFVGLHFLHAVSSGMVHGVDRDARRIVEAVASRTTHRSYVRGTRRDKAVRGTPAESVANG